MKELIENLRREIMRKGITMVMQEKVNNVRIMQNGGQLLEEYNARLEYQIALALASK